jgi:hypothetical protein
LNVVNIKEKTFIEFGVEDFSESNCRYLLTNNNWSGFVIDGSEEKVEKIRKSNYFWRHSLNTLSAFITKENVNDILMKSGFGKNLGVLLIDIDGNDYHIFDEINFFTPSIIICEYNSIFGPERKISVPYAPHFYRILKHYSNLYFGASLSAITYLANKKGYSLAGTNSAGVNAFFLRNDLISDKIRPQTAQQAWFPSSFRESRDSEGKLTLLSGDDRLALLKGLPVLNVESGELEEI